jgi:hypothetical protein
VIEPRIETLDNADDQNKCLVSHRHSVYINIRNFSNVFEYDYADLFISTCIFVIICFPLHVWSQLEYCHTVFWTKARMIREGRIDLSETLYFFGEFVNLVWYSVSF